MSRFKLDKTQSPPVVIDTSTGSTLTIDEVYKRRWQTTDLAEETELTFMLCEVEQHAWEKTYANRRKGTPTITHHIDEAAQIIADAVGDAMLTDVAAQALADAGLLMPDLPAPYKPRAWQAGIADVRRINPRADEVEKVEVIVFHSNGRIYCSKEQARSLALALLAAAQWEEGKTND